MKKFVTVSICIILTISMMVSFNVSAANASVKPTKSSDRTLLLEIDKLLKESTSSEREKLLEKVSYAGITQNDLSGVLLTDKEIAVLGGIISITKSPQLDKRILKAPSSSGFSLHSTTSMPDYALWPDIYMQETGIWCRAGVIQTVLMYISGSSPSQQTIVNNCLASLPYMANYLNQNKPDNYTDYLYSLYGGDQDEFKRRLA